MENSNNVTVKKSGCMGCHGGCGILVHVVNGKAVKLEGDPDCPNNEGKLCPKGRAGLDLLYHPDRLKYPLKRRGVRGEGKWGRISWDQALDEISEKLKAIRERYGPWAMAAGDGTKLHEVSWVTDLFCFHFGSPNNFDPSRPHCFRPRLVSSVWTYGGYFTPDYLGHPKCVVLWADQPDASNHNTILGRNVSKALKNHPKLIVVDPRRTHFAKRADVWLRLRPGTDAAVALAWMHVILHENLYDYEFVEHWTNAPFLVRTDTGHLLTDSNNNYLVWDAASGQAQPADSPGVQPSLVGSYEISGMGCKPVWQLLMERVEDYPPERVAEIAWVEAEEIRKAARIYATMKPACMGWGVGIDMLVSTHQTPRAICILESITGNLDVPGGNFNPVPGHYGVVSAIKRYADGLPSEVFEKQLGGDKYKLLSGHRARVTAHYPSILRAIIEEKPYPVKALFNIGCNPLLSLANTEKVYEALKKVQLSVVSDLFMTPTGQLADYVLPAASYFEKNRLIDTNGVNPWGNVMTQKVVEPIGESRDEFEFMGDLLRRCGLAKDWRWHKVEEFYDDRLQETGLTWKKVVQAGGVWDQIRYRKYETDYYRKGGGFRTPTGKVEIYSTYWQDLGYDPLPIYLEPPESPYSTPEIAREYPFVITTGGKVPWFFHSQHRQIERLRKHHPYPLMQIHPASAERLGLRDGDWTWIESPRGKCIQRVKIFDGIDERVIHAEHGWWFPEQEGAEPHLYGVFQSNINCLTSDEPPFLDIGFGGCNLRGFLAKVYKAGRQKKLNTEHSSRIR
jgi:anaerobic selenocysteine-containing dehydrogenase